MKKLRMEQRPDGQRNLRPCVRRARRVRPRPVHAVYDIESGGKGMDYCEVREIRFPDHLGAGHPDDQPATVRHGGRWYCEDCYESLVLGGEPGARWWYEDGAEGRP